MTSPPEVDVAVARADERGVIANMMQLYVHDFSEQWSDQARGELGDDGLFEPYPLDSYWADPDHIPLLLKVAGRPIGFALVNARSHSGRPVDRNMAEFFVVRKHRRAGAGAVAARAIFTLYPGLWEAAVARRNVGALHFWRKTVAGCPAVTGHEEEDVTTSEWNGPILRFHVGAGGRDA